ncbi:MAG: hypothetical protein R3318_02770 [Gammaproteobacteria bacterium]|nr:hypothetical protein [Gammaproteobacteria bacterium]
MPSFTEILTASDAELVKIFYKIKSDPKDDFIVRINKVAAQLGLNHTQLICALGFNKHIRDLTDIHSILGFRSFKVLTYREEELFSTDTYNQLSIDNILDIYSERLEDQEILDRIRTLMIPRLKHIELDIEKNDDPSHVISYRMEVHSIYNAGIADKNFCDERLKQDNGKFRHMANEVILIVDAGFYPPTNLFFMDTLTAEERKDLIEHKDIPTEVIKNRLQNQHIPEEERAILEDFI